ncbi:MAG: RICIN domain-containing protein [bacterium]|nr:RICIN domain-containing protein [bacterium]
MAPQQDPGGAAGSNARPSIPCRAMLLFGALTSGAFAQTWNGAYTIAPVSAPGMVLEAAGSVMADGSAVTIGASAGTANQIWIISHKRDNLFAIRPVCGAGLAMAAARGGADNGTPIVLETDRGSDWQLWEIRQNESRTCSLIPKHAPAKGLDNNGGRTTPGARQDLWDFKPQDAHMQWLIRPVGGAPDPASPMAAHRMTLPPAQDYPKENVPRGRIENLTFAASAIFPGTVRDVTVFIPAQYDAGRPACVYVATDGFRPPEKAILEGLIAAGDIPPLIGVFVKPGQLPPPDEGAMGRRNRCLEYDGLGDANARFFIDEILPFVARELKLNLSVSGDDRCIAGGSSGGITAFNAAWERPDAFSRVYCVSGSFVAFRGGNQFPTLVRKFEAKPIRAYLTTGTQDMENCAGDWFLIDQEMDKALTFSGYDYRFRIIEGRHGAGYIDCLPEAMRYLWKDWPKPVEAGPSAPRVQDVILPGEAWQTAGEGFGDARGPACNAVGEVFFVDRAANKIFRIGLDGAITEFAADAGRANGLTIGPRGDLYSVSSRTGRIMRYGPTGEAAPVVDGLRGDSIMADPQGGLYVTCAGAEPGGPGEVWLVKEGRKTRVDSGLKRATGLALRPDHWLLSVADGASKWVYSYQITPDGALVNKERFFWLMVPDWEDDAGAESVCYAREGQMLVATCWGIQVCADDGPTQVVLPMPDRSRPMGVCLGGPGGDTLFAFCGGKIWKRKVKTHAVGAFSPRMKINGTPL